MKDHQIIYKIREKLGDNVKIILPKDNLVDKFFKYLAEKLNINL